MENMLALLQNDEYLRPFSKIIENRHNQYLEKLNEYTHGTNCVKDFSLGYLYYGVHKIGASYVFREWAPNATHIYLKGDFNKWKVSEEYKFENIGNGNWELYVPDENIQQGDLYKLEVRWEGGMGERIPAYVRCVKQDDKTKVFSAKIELGEEYVWKNKAPLPSKNPLIYEAHIGMSGEEMGVASYEDFRKYRLPYIHKLGYDTIQLMAIQEHPYYGSFGYHVSSFYAPSSRFGSADELKQLIDEAHGLGISVVMDIVHSHAVKNEEEGLGCYDGSQTQFFYEGARREHPAWDSLCFDYGKDEVVHFLLSNIRYWIDEFHFDGFRFDGVTSMLYLHHGLEVDFSGYQDYFDGGQDINAIIYLSLANKLVHELNPNAITIAEEMSGMPGLAMPLEDGGMGFDFRMAMGIPDFWIKMIKEKLDQNWEVGHIFYELTNKRMEERVISYAESHDQALVGDKTIFFRLVDRNIYEHMQKTDTDITIARGLALHKMIRLITLSTAGGGYLNFMGNEFGHPEWIDFPREGNNWSYKYARRQWNLVENTELKYQYLYAFDKAILELIRGYKTLENTEVYKIWENKEQQVLAFIRGDLLFVFNFNPQDSFSDYKINVPAAKYKLLLSSDELSFGGQGLVDKNVSYTPQIDMYGYVLQLYIPARSSLVFRIKKSKSVY